MTEACKAARPFVGERVRVTLRQPCGQHGEEWHGSDGIVYARNVECLIDDHPYLVMHEATLSNGLRGAWAEWFAAGEIAPLGI